MSKLTRERIDEALVIIDGTGVEEAVAFGEITTDELVFALRIARCFDGVSAEDIFRTTVHANPSSTTDMDCASRVEDALTMLASLLRESEKGGGT